MLTTQTSPGLICNVPVLLEAMRSQQLCGELVPSTKFSEEFSEFSFYMASLDTTHAFGCGMPRPGVSARLDYNWLAGNRLCHAHHYTAMTPLVPLAVYSNAR